MTSIVAQHVLPHFLKHRQRLSTEQIVEMGSGVDLIYFPVGATIAVNTNERKYRFIEQVGNIFIERYCLLPKTKHAVSDMDVLFARIFDGSTFVKYIVNRSGIQRVLKDWRAFVDDGKYSGRSLFVNDLNINGLDNYLETLLYDTPDGDLYPENALSRFYQTDNSGLFTTPAKVSHPIAILHDYMDTRMRSIISGVPMQLMTLKNSPDDVTCNTGKLPKIDFFSWLTRDGDLSTSDLYPHVTKVNRWLLLKEDDLGEHTRHLLDLNKHYDVAYLLQLSCLTDFNLCYILPNRKIEFRLDASSVLCRYANITNKETMEYVHTLGLSLGVHWPNAQRIEITKTWQNDAYITVVYDNTSVTYYVDLTIFALLTRGISHL